MNPLLFTKPSKNLYFTSQTTVMNRAKLLRLSIGLANSFSSTRLLGLTQLSSIQVTRLSYLTNSLPFPFSTTPSTVHKPLNLQQNVFFSSKPQSFIDLVLSAKNWSQEIENESEKLNPKLTHDLIVYVLVKSKDNPQKSLDFFNWACDIKGFDPKGEHFGLLLRSLACKEFMEDFWIVASKLKKIWFNFDSRVYSAVFERLRQQNLQEDLEKWNKKFQTMIVPNDVVKDVVDLILGSDWEKKVEDLLKKKVNFPVPEDLLVRVVVELIHKPLKALEFFEWFGSCGGYEHDCLTYNVMAKVLAKEESLSEFWEFVKRMRDEGYEMDIETYARCVRQLPTKDAIELFEFMMDGPYKPSSQDCAFILRKISLDTDVDTDSVQRVLRKFVATGDSPNKIVYDGIHRALCNAGRFDEAKKIVEELRNAGYKPDNFTYGQEISGLCKAKKLEEAWNVMERMEAEGCVPDVRTWTMLIEGYCMAKQVDQALSCFAKMEDKNVHPDSRTLNSVVCGLISEDKFMAAYNFLTKMVNKKLKPLHDSYWLVFQKLAKCGKIDEALDIFRLARQDGYLLNPDPITQAISKSGTVYHAKILLRLISLKGSPGSYAHVIRSFTEQGRLSEANELVNDIPFYLRKAKELQEFFSNQVAQSGYNIVNSRPAV